jgi:hypothetical protein
MSLFFLSTKYTVGESTPQERVLAIARASCFQRIEKKNNQVDIQSIYRVIKQLNFNIQR